MKWIFEVYAKLLRKSLPVRGAWIEMVSMPRIRSSFWSLPVRGAWIEMVNICITPQHTNVAPRAGSVD